MRVAVEEGEVAVVLRLVLVHPRQEVLPRLDLQVAVDRAAEPLALEPLARPVVEDRVDRVMSDSVGAHMTPPGIMNDECGHCPPKIA